MKHSLLNLIGKFRRQIPFFLIAATMTAAATYGFSALDVMIERGNYSREIAQAETHHDNGMIALQQNRAAEALEHFKKSHEADRQNDEFRLWLARSLIWNGLYSEGLEHLKHLQSLSFKPGEVSHLTAQALFWSGNPAMAVPEFDKAAGLGIGSAELFADRGEVYMALASFSKALDDFTKAAEVLDAKRESPDQPENLDGLRKKIAKNHAFCNSYMGNDSAAETELLELHSRFPEEIDVTVELRRVLRRNGRLAMALDLLHESREKFPDNRSILFEIGDCHILTGQWHQTRSHYEQGIAMGPVSAEVELRWANRLAQIRNFPQAAEIMGRLLPESKNKTGESIELAWTMASMERYEEAEGMLLDLPAGESSRPEAKLMLARVKLLQKKHAEAKELALEVLDENSESSAAQAIITDAEAFDQKPDLDYRLPRHNRIEELELKLEAEPDNFPVVFDLAQELANQKEFDQALCHLDHLLCLYPEHYAARLMRARILGWSRRFFCSLSEYCDLADQEQENPIYCREAGRTAFWANEVETALCWYDGFLEPPVSEKLHEAIVAEATAAPVLSAELEKLVSNSKKPAFQRFEEFSQWFSSARPQFTPASARKIDLALRELHTEWLLQRHFYLESQGKLLNYRRRPRQALKAFDRLLETEPANLEVLFDRSQIFCSLGLPDHERDTYRTILRYAPDHNLIRDALNKIDDDERPLLRFRYHSQQEKGRGDLARMRMHGSRFEALAYLNPRWRATIAGSSRYYLPGIWQGRFRSFETGLALEGVLSTRTRLNAGISNNRFTRNRMAQHLSPRSEVYSNDVALRDGTMLDNSFIALRYPLARRFLIGAKLEEGRYSDANRLRVVTLHAQYDLTEFPEIFRLILTGERRHARHTSRYAFLNGDLIDIKYPYWTPQNYRGHNLALQYYRDLSRIRICRADKQYFSAMLSLSDDSIGNPGRRLDWQWHLDWKNRWETELSSYWHDSDDWKSHRYDFYIGYRF